MRVTKIFTFDAAHQLTKYKGECEPLHGHTYTLHITVEGPVREDGLVADFLVLKKVAEERVLKKLDHTNLNDVIENPSAENIAKWIWEKLQPIDVHLGIPNIKLVEVKVFETATSFVTYYGD